MKTNELCDARKCAKYSHERGRRAANRIGGYVHEHYQKLLQRSEDGVSQLIQIEVNIK